MNNQSYFINFFKHFNTVRKHRALVRRDCFQMGLFWQGLTHDLSKYSYTEFSAGVKYYQGNRSPNAQERLVNGYSLAWMHHKGRNRHHYEYWTECNLNTMRYEPLDLPNRYFAEMIADRIAASKTYLGKSYTDDAPLQYHNRSRECNQMNPLTVKKLEFVLNMLSTCGEKPVLQFLRKICDSNIPFDGWEIVKEKVLT